MTLIFLCLLTTSTWKAAKWVEIRYKTMTMVESSFITRFLTYFRQRETDDQASLMLASFKKTLTISKEAKDIIKADAQ